MPMQVSQGVLLIAPDAPVLSRLDFRWRLTLQEQVAVKRAELEHPDPTVRAQLAILRESLAEVTDRAGVNVTDPRTIGGAEIIVDVLIAAGIVPMSDKAARLASLLVAP